MSKIIQVDKKEDLLQRAAELVVEKASAKKDLSDTLVVFEGVRPGVYFKHKLAGVLGKSFLAPSCFSINDLVEYIVGQGQSFNMVTELDAAHKLYNIIERICPDIFVHKLKFAEFLVWSKELIRFIDKTCFEDKEDMFLESIQDNALIGYDVPEKINRLLAHILSIKKEFIEQLTKENKYTRGMLFQKAMSLSKGMVFKGVKKIIFVNILFYQKAEETILKNIAQKHQTTFLYQGNADKWNILKGIYGTLGFPVDKREDKTMSSNVRMYAAKDSHSQCAMVRQIVSDINDIDNTLVVLPDQNNMVPLFSMLSSLTGNINVSMGYPINRSSLYELIDMIINSQNTKKDHRYYTKDHLAIIKHPIVKNMDIGYGSNLTRVIAQVIEDVFKGDIESKYNGQIFIDIHDQQLLEKIYSIVVQKADNVDIKKDDIVNTLLFLHDQFFNKWEGLKTFQGLAGCIRGFIDVIMTHSDPSRYPLQYNVLESLQDVAEQLESIEFLEEYSLEEIFIVFVDMLQTQRTKFAGAPLSGIQISEVMETRCLSFEHVIVMDLNEGVIPYVQICEPLIPLEIMRMLGLSHPETEQEIQKYHFNRIVDSAKKVHLLYKDTKETEKSRFLEDLIWQQQKYSKRIDVVDPQKGQFKTDPCVNDSVKVKDENILNIIKGIPFSASSINTYIECPMKFYYRYILGLKEKENMLEGVEARHVGDFIHKLFEEFFKKKINVPLIVDEKTTKELSQFADTIYKKDFEHKMGVQKDMFEDILKDRLDLFLEFEKERADGNGISVLMVEEAFNDVLKTKTNEFKITAKIDRVDRDRSGNVFVLDYKTGATTLMPVKAQQIKEEEFSREYIKEKVRSVQLPIYLYLLKSSKKIDLKQNSLNAGLYYIRSAQIKWLFSEKEKGLTEDAMQIYMKAVEFILDEIAEKKRPFTCDKQGRTCAMCPYQLMC